IRYLRRGGCTPYRRAVRHTLGESHDFWLNIPVLDAAPFLSCAAPSGLNFVTNKDAAIAPHDLGDDLEIILWRSDESAYSHDRLGYECGHLTRGRCLYQLLHVARAFQSARLGLKVEWAAITVWGVRGNDPRYSGGTMLPWRVAGRGHRQHRAPVISVPQCYYLVVARIDACQQHRRLVRFGAAIGKKALLQPSRRERGHLFGEVHLRPVYV